MTIKISPSLLACDLSRLMAEGVDMAQAGADMLHLDVMDGHFVPNISFGAPVIKCLRDKTPCHFDTHLMISHPLRYVDDFIKAGSDTITFHLESESPVEQTLRAIKGAGRRAGLSLKPDTAAEAVFAYLEMVDMILVMTVEPGFGGQKFMEAQCAKISLIAAELKRRGLTADIQVDGGIDEATGPLAARAGANVFVAGSSLYGKGDYTMAVRALRLACEKAYQG